MPFSPALLAGTGFVAVASSWITYFAGVPSGNVSRRPYGHLALQGLGVGLGLTGMALALQSGQAWGLAVALGTPAAILGGLFSYLYTQRATPLGQLSVAVGDTLRPFSALTPEGETFDAATLRGKRVLLKFFRGHW